MNRNLQKAIFDIGKVDAIMYAIEHTYIDDPDDDQEAKNRAAYAFYALWDSIKALSEDLDRLAADGKVVDAVYAVKEARRQICTLKTDDR